MKGQMMFRQKMIRPLLQAVAILALVTAPAAHAGLNDVPAELKDLIALDPAPGPVADAVFYADTASDETVALPQARLTVVNFWATWCAPCKEEMPSLNEAAHQLRDDGVQIVTVSLDRSAKAAEAFFAQHGLDALIPVYDRRMAAFQALEGLGVPYTIVLDAEGQRLGSLSGILDWASEDSLALLRALAL